MKTHSHSLSVRLGDRGHAGLVPPGQQKNIRSSQRIAVVQSLSCVRLCDPMDCSMPGFPVLPQLPVRMDPLECSAVGQTLVEMAVLEADLLEGPQQAYVNVRQHMGLSKASKHLISVCKFHSVISRVTHNSESGHSDLSFFFHMYCYRVNVWPTFASF